MFTTTNTITGEPGTRDVSRRLRGIDRFMPFADVVDKHDILIDAPADVVMDVAMNLDIEGIPAVRFIFWAREKILGSKPVPRKVTGLAALTRSLGWSVLSVRPGREYVSGAVTQPWEADVVFHSVHPSEFFDFAEPEQVKIAWSLEVESMSPTSTRFVTETRAVATDAAAREKFRRYWRFFGVGIVAIRLLLLPAVRREAERRYAQRKSGRGHSEIVL